MARVYLLSGQQPYREVFVVDQSVGDGRPNRRDDVLLVQLLLRIATEAGTDSPGYQPPGEPMIEVDGMYGTHTQTYISFFQKEVDRRRNRNLVEQDGVVDPVRSGSSSSSITHTFYTILALNSAMRTRRGDAFRMENEPTMQDDLRKSLFINW